MGRVGLEPHLASRTMEGGREDKKGEEEAIPSLYSMLDPPLYHPSPSRSQSQAPSTHVLLLQADQVHLDIDVSLET